MAKVNLSQLPACVEDARVAWLDTDRGPPDPTNYASLQTRLGAAPAKLPPLYRDAAAEPFLAAITHLGAVQFAEVLRSDPTRESTAGLLLDILIRDASDNRRSLDDVLRGLYQSTYKKGRGFTTAEWWTAVSAAAGGTCSRSSAC